MKSRKYILFRNLTKFEISNGIKIQVSSKSCYGKLSFSMKNENNIVFRLPVY